MTTRTNDNPRRFIVTVQVTPFYVHQEVERWMTDNEDGRGREQILKSMAWNVELVANDFTEAITDAIHGVSNQTQKWITSELEVIAVRRIRDVPTIRVTRFQEL
jgi:hypothetical protein